MSTLKEQLTDLRDVVAAALDDVDKFETKGNHSAGVRVRAAMQTLAKTGKQVRKDVIDKINADKANKPKKGKK